MKMNERGAKAANCKTACRSQAVWALNQSGILDVLLYMSSENEKQYFMHIVEIASHLLREQNPRALAHAQLQRGGRERLRDDQQLLALRAAEARQRLRRLEHYSSARWVDAITGARKYG